MRTTIILLAGAMVAGVLATGASSAGSARLLLMDSEPLLIRGVGFKAAEHVRLEAAEGKRDVTRSATASASGGFTMRLTGIDTNACAGFAVTALGDKGSRATFKRVRGQCPILVDPGD